MSDVLVLCKKCGNKVPSSSLKLDLDEGKVICPDCIKSKKVHKEIQTEVFHKKEAEKEDDYKPLKTMHKCQSCDYSFKINQETKTPKNCPYCGARILGF